MSSISEYLATIGAKGGQATGESKVRGNAAHYRAMGLASAKAAAKRRKAKAEAEAKAEAAKRPASHACPCGPRECAKHRRERASAAARAAKAAKAAKRAARSGK